MKGSVVRIQLLIAALSLTFINSTETADYRLSKSVLPSFYNLTIKVQEGKYTKFGGSFIGEVSIKLQTNRSDVNEITLHKESLTILSCLIYNKDNLLQQNVTNTSLMYNRETHQLTVPLIQPLIANENYTLYFKYIGYNRYEKNGLFSTFYKTDKRSYNDFMFTQLEAVYARKVFPCFDEPTFKAKFQLHIGRPSGYNVTTNTRLIKTTNEGDEHLVDHFDVTPIMSTYLLAILISKFQARGNLSDFAVLAPPEYYNYTEFSYTVGETLVAAYGELFQMPYKELGNEVLRFASAHWTKGMAMENWGLIIFSEEMLLHKPGYSDGHKNEELACRMIAHELAHMWFGNSVTLSWWSHFWLNEGFARFYEIFMTNELDSKYRMYEQFVVDNLQRVLELDAVSTAQPLTSPEKTLESSAGINNQSNVFTYDKGASIIRMWRNIMGGDNFNKSISSYLKQYHLKNAIPRDLFAHLKQNWPAQPPVDLDTFFSDYTEQVGYPVVIVNITEDKQRVILHQKRFLSDPEDGSDATLRYTIPITFMTNHENYNNLTPYTYFEKNMSTVEISFKEPIDWIILNLKQSNYYRIFYDKPILDQIKLRFSNFQRRIIPVESKAQIIDDLFNFALAGMIDYADVFEFLEHLSNEDRYIVWRAAYHGMERVAKRLDPKYLPHFEKFLTNITTLVFSLKTAKSSDYDRALDVYNRDMHVSWLCKYQNTDCTNQVKLLFEGNVERPSPDYRATFYCAASRTTAHALLWHLYQNETDADEKELLAQAISCTRDYRTFLKLEVLQLFPREYQIDGLLQIYQQNPDLVTPILSTISENIEQL
ncbi:hypothetical protein KR093_002953, partial [Drosophila rubida]